MPFKFIQNIHHTGHHKPKENRSIKLHRVAEFRLEYLQLAIGKDLKDARLLCIIRSAIYHDHKNSVARSWSQGESTYSLVQRLVVD